MRQCNTCKIVKNLNQYYNTRPKCRACQITSKGARSFPVGEPGQHWCKRCLDFKPLNQFRFNRRNGSRGRMCRPCLKVYNREFEQRKLKDPEYKRIRRAKARAVRLKYVYKISVEEYAKMLESQGGVCAICKQPEFRKTGNRSWIVGKISDLAVDHCHATGKIRGLLCTGCNTSLGQFKENIETILQAAIYLEHHRQIA